MLTVRRLMAWSASVLGCAQQSGEPSGEDTEQEPDAGQPEGPPSGGSTRAERVVAAPAKGEGSNGSAPVPWTMVTFDAFRGRYASRTAGMTASEIRALFAVASRPEVVSLAGGMPYTTALPLDAVGKLMSDLLATKGATALQYGSGQGDPELRERICEIMALEGVEGSPDDVVVTVGSQHALDLVTKIFFDPGDVVLAEAPSYVGALGTFAGLPGRGRARRDGRGRADPRGAARGDRRGRGARQAGQAALHDPQLPQPRRHLAVRAARATRSWRSAPPQACWCSRTTRTGCSASTARRPRRSGRGVTRTRSSTSGRSARPSRRACGSAGCSRRTRCGRSWCSPPRRRCSARRRSTRWSSSSTSRARTGRARSRSSRSSTASGATRCSTP